GGHDVRIAAVSDRPSGKTPWRVKLSQRPIGLGERRPKREAIFRADEETTLSVRASLWSAYAGRNRHGDRPELRKGDLVWLQPVDPTCRNLICDNQIKSIQWARWGREGERLLDVIARSHADRLPDALNPDGHVDEITNLFGHVPRPDLADEVEAFRDWKQRGLPGPASAFAARIRPGNLIFENARHQVKKQTMAPLAPPHPGCAAFYREMGHDLGRAADKVNNVKKPIRGYKTYRTSKERGREAPWDFEVQGVYDDKGRPKKGKRQKVNKTCDLLPEDLAPPGRLRCTVRALSSRELMLLLAACSVDWRLGGGKPLGLGHCKVVSVTLRAFHDDGSLGPPMRMEREGQAVATLPDAYAAELKQDEQLNQRLKLWQASQRAVPRIRYPRAVKENRNRKTYGGHAWFQRHATSQKAGKEGEVPEGLQVLHVAGDLRDKAAAGHIRAQVLPVFDPDHPEADVLYGYDLFCGEGLEWSELSRDRKTEHKKFEPFDEEKHARSSDDSGGFHGQDRDSRQQGRKNRPRE
ncbi:MAG: hypothetical protein AAF492_13705, partial [Verrucomicrobiota bacterium]